MNLDVERFARMPLVLIWISEGALRMKLLVTLGIIAARVVVYAAVRIAPEVE